MSTQPFHIIAPDHTGITATNLEWSLAFWRDGLGVRILASNSSCQRFGGRSDRRAKGETHACGAGSARAQNRTDRVFTPRRIGRGRDNLDAVLARIAASSWKAAGSPRTLASGPNAGKRVVYVRDPDGTMIEFMQPPPAASHEGASAG